MGRVYAIEPDKAKGELFGGGLLPYYADTDTPLRLVYRIEFDEDADSGPATVYAYVTAGDGVPFLDLAGEPVRVVYRCLCRVERRVNPAETTDAPIVVEAGG